VRTSCSSNIKLLKFIMLYLNQRSASTSPHDLVGSLGLTSVNKLKRLIINLELVFSHLYVSNQSYGKASSAFHVVKLNFELICNQEFIVR